MRNAQPDCRWEEGVVDERKEHIELCFGKEGETPYENWKPIARIAKPKHHVFAVECLATQDSPGHQAM